ncbi:hypothetical protein [Lactovum odontotermitis]
MIGGALLDLVGVPLLSGAVSMEGVGTAAVIAGSATVGSALSKMNVPVGSLQYSFAKGYEERSKAVEETDKKIDELTNGLDDITKRTGSNKNFKNTGGVEQVDKDFDYLDLSDMKSITNKYGEKVRTGKLPDGSSVSTRYDSQSKDLSGQGYPTLQITRPDGTQIKIRYPK